MEQDHSVGSPQNHGTVRVGRYLKIPTPAMGRDIFHQTRLLQDSSNPTLNNSIWKFSVETPSLHSCSHPTIPPFAAHCPGSSILLGIAASRECGVPSLTSCHQQAGPQDGNGAPQRTEGSILAWSSRAVFQGLPAGNGAGCCADAALATNEIL